jgi:predicted nucleic acid-binding protein
LILADSSIWIDYFRGARTPAAERLDELLGAEVVLIGDLILAEVLQGFTTERAFNLALSRLGALDVVVIGGRDIAIAAARNYRSLRSKGVTVRKTIDALIATRCIHDGYELLYSDRDFDPFVEHLGLISANPGDS